MSGVSGVSGLLRMALMYVPVGALCGCALPQSTVGLDKILSTELAGWPRAGASAYRCTVGAHRGDSVACIENTVDSILAARQSARYAFIECDVQYTKDGRVVVFHDARLRRLYGRMARVEDSTYDELMALSSGEIASYEKVMAAASGKKLNIEIKSHGDAELDRRLAEFVVRDVHARRLQKDVLISSISADIVKYVKLAHPEMAVGQIFWIKVSTFVHFDFLTERLYRELSNSHADYLMLHVANLRNIEDLLRIKPKGKTVVFWTFKDAMYVVHKDLSDRLWGDSWLQTWYAQMRYRVSRGSR